MSIRPARPGHGRPWRHRSRRHFPATRWRSSASRRSAWSEPWSRAWASPTSRRGPGHYPHTPLPGQPGNAAIAGHRTTYGAPFYDLDDLEPGDEILVRTLQGEFTYEVTSTEVVSPDQTQVLAPTDDDRLTLTTCEPRFSARRRLIVTALLLDPPAPAPAPAPVPVDDDRDGGDEPVPRFEEAGLSGDPAARWPTFWWGLLAAVVAVATVRGARWWRRWPAYAVGVPVFLVVLFVFFEQVARLLPANV